MRGRRGGGVGRIVFLFLCFLDVGCCVEDDDDVNDDEMRMMFLRWIGDWIGGGIEKIGRIIGKIGK